jgi:hypothetical protein
MECIVTVKEPDGTKSKHPAIGITFIDAVEDFCHDYGYKLNDIVAVVVIDQ